MKEKLSFRNYISGNRRTMVLLGMFVTAFFLIRLLFPTVGYDTDEWVVSPESTLLHWENLGRYSLVWMKRLTGNGANLYLMNGATAVNVYLYTVLFLYFLNRTGRAGGWKRDLLCGMVLVSAPIFCEQYYFTLQSAEVSFSMLLMMAAFLLTRRVLERWEWLSAAGLVVLLLFVFGAYQAFVNVYVVGVLICLYGRGSENKRDNLGRIETALAIFFVSLLGHLGIAYLVRGGTFAAQSGYLEVVWLQEPFYIGLKNIIFAVGKVVLGYGTILNLSYTFCMIFVFVQIKRGGFALSWKHFYLLALLASPFLLHIVTGQPLNAPRAALSLPLLCAFLFWKYYGAGRWPSRALCLIIASQLIHSQLLMYSDYLRNENDKAIAEKIYKDCGADEDTVIVFKGVRHAEDSVPVLLGHVIGRSFFEWTPMTDVNNASVHRIRCFMEFYGMDFVCPDDATAARGEEIAFPAAYPEEGYIVELDGVYYVNLGD